MNCYKKNVILVPGCLLCPSYQVNYDKTPLAWRDEWLSFLLEYGFEIIQMPCPEVLFGGYENGLKRKPHGIRYYEKLQGFKEHCDYLATEIVKQVSALKKQDYRVTAILGVENSPTCAVSRMFTYGIGTEHRQGLLIESIREKLYEMNIVIPFVGISRYKKSQEKEIDQIISEIDRDRI